MGVQLPVVLRLLQRVASFAELSGRKREDGRPQFRPVFVGRGVVQISGYVDAWLASWLGTGALSGIFLRADSFHAAREPFRDVRFGRRTARTCPARSASDSEVAEALRARLDPGPAPDRIFCAAVGGGVSGSRRRDRRAPSIKPAASPTADALYVWAILAGATVGLLASTLGRLYSSAYYALRDTRTPLRFAIVRVALTTILGYLCALPLPRALGIDARWGAVGLTVSAGIASWVEFTLLRRRLESPHRPHRSFGRLSREALGRRRGRGFAAGRSTISFTRIHPFW